MRVESAANAGAYLVSAGGVQTFQYAHLPGTVYRIPAVALRVAGVLTNTAPVGVTRGPGFAEAVNIIERLIDRAARQSGFDRAELRRKNLVPAAAMPMVNAVGSTGRQRRFSRDLRSRAHSRPMSRALPRAAAESEARGLLRGLGFAYHIKATGGAPSENVDIRFEANGTVSLITGTQTIGQGHETTFPQILAERLGSAERAHPPRPGRHRPDPGGRRPRQLARDLHGRHRDLAGRGRDHRQRAPASPPRRWKRPRPTSASRTEISSWPAPTAGSG